MNRSSTGGFTLAEMLVMIAVVGLTLIIGLPALLNMIERSKHEAALRETATLIRAARLDAIRHTTNMYVQGDFVTDSIRTFREADGNGVLSAGDIQVTSFALGGVMFWGDPDPGPEGPNAIIEFGPDGHDYVTFDTNGAADATGAFRFGDRRGNRTEIALDVRATGHIEMRKLDDGGVYREQGENGESWQWN